jgi:hypothetical protein
LAIWVSDFCDLDERESAPCELAKKGFDPSKARVLALSKIEPKTLLTGETGGESVRLQLVALGDVREQLLAKNNVGWA